MPTQRGILGTPLNPKQAQEKLTGLITEIGGDDPDTPEPEAVVETPVVTEPTPPETPPQTSDTADELPEDETTRVTLPVDGEPTEVTLAELKKSYSFQAHNTRKAQELADREQRLEPEIRQRVESEMIQERQEYQQGLAQLNAAIQRLEGEPDWVKVRAETSDADFLKQKADWEAGKWQREQLVREEQRVAELNRQAQDKQYANYLRAEEDKLRAAIPDWVDQTKAKTELAKLATFVRQTYQIPDAQVANAFTSASAILLARDAMRYRELHREPVLKPKVSSIRPARPGTPERPRPNEQHVKKLDRAQQSGRQRDAAAAIEDLLSD